MTIQPYVLEARLGQLQAKVQRTLAGGSAADALELADCWRALDSADRELIQALRQLDALEQERALLPGGQIDGAFENDLLRVQRRAGLLASAIVQLRRHGGDVSSVDLTHAVCHIGTQMGRSLDQMMVRLTVQRLSTQPLWVSTVAPAFAHTSASKANATSVTETLFVAISVVLGLIRRRSARGL
jgi:hypothetical protein